MKISVVIGTNRAGAQSRKLGQILAEQYRSLAHDIDLLDLEEMTPDFLSPDAYENPSDGVKRLVDRFLQSDGVCFVIPEYNGSYPGVLKLFVDMLPYPEGFDGRPCAFVGLAGGQFAALRAVEHFQGVAGYRNAYMFPRRVFIPKAFGVFDDDAQLKDDELRDRLFKQSEGFCAFIAAIKDPDGASAPTQTKSGA